MMSRFDPDSRIDRMTRVLRVTPPALFLALAAYAVMMVFSAPQPWPALAGAIAGGWLLGRLSRRPTPHR